MIENQYNVHLFHKIQVWIPCNLLWNTNWFTVYILISYLLYKRPLFIGPVHIYPSLFPVIKSNP